MVIVVTVAPPDADTAALKFTDACAVKISDADAATLRAWTADFGKRGMLRIREGTLRRQHQTEPGDFYNLHGQPVT